MSNEFITGDSRTKLIQLQINELPFVIAPTDTVKAQIVSKDKAKVLTTEAVTCISTGTGAAWATSLIAVKFPRASTADIKTFGAALLEIQVTLDPLGDAEDITFYTPIVLVKGSLV